MMIGSSPVKVFLAGTVTGACLVAAYFHLVGRRKRSHLRVARNLLDLVGETPLVRIPSLSEETGCEIYAKCEWLNPCGSSKDRIAKEILLQALNSGKLCKNGTVVEATSGSTGISLSRMARALGVNALIVVPDDQAKEKISLLNKLGAVVKLVKPASIVHPENNVNVARRLAKEMPNAYFADQFENEINVLAQVKTGNEIWEQTRGRIDAFVIGAGTAGTIAGVAQVLKSHSPLIKIFLADPQGSSLFNAVKHGVLYAPEQSERTIRRHRVDTIVEGVGLDRMTGNFKRAQLLVDDAIKVTDDEVVRMARKLLMDDGFFVGSSSALNCVAAVEAARRLGPGHVIITVLCSSGEREITKVHDVEFCRAQGIVVD